MWNVLHCLLVGWVLVILLLKLTLFVITLPKAKVTAFNKNLMVEDFEENRVNRFVYQVEPKSFHSLVSEARNPLNPYADGFSFDLYAYVSENEASIGSERKLIWTERTLTYGPDSSLAELRTGIPISEVSDLFT